MLNHDRGTRGPQVWPNYCSCMGLQQANSFQHGKLLPQPLSKQFNWLNREESVVLFSTLPLSMLLLLLLALLVFIPHSASLRWTMFNSWFWYFPVSKIVVWWVNFVRIFGCSKLNFQTKNQWGFPLSQFITRFGGKLNFSNEIKCHYCDCFRNWLKKTSVDTFTLIQLL